MKTLDEILAGLQVAADVAASYPPTALPAALAAKLLSIVQAAVTAHESATGKPLDLTQLHQITPVA